MKKSIVLSALMTLQSTLGFANVLATHPNEGVRNAPYRSPQSEESAQKETMAQLLKSSVIMDAASKLIEKVQQEFSNLQQSASKEIDKYKIDLKVPVIEIGRSGTYYQYVVEPAFVNGQHTRQDIWVIELGTPWNGLQVGTQLRVTFNRLFNTKWEAMKAKPYFPVSIEKLNIQGKFPWSARDVNTLMKNGDVARLELFGSVGFGVSKSHSLISGGSTSIGASTAREALFLMDIYKHNAETVRSRFLALKNKGHISLSLSAGIAPDINFPLIDKIIGLKALLRFDKSTFNMFDPSEEYPIDSMMLDYVYSFKNDKNAGEQSAESAFDDVLKNITSLGFADIFDPRVSDDQLKDILMTKIAKSDNFAREDYVGWRQGQVRAEDIRVRRLFKGRVMSTNTSITGKVRAGQMVKIDGLSSNSRSFVVANDMNEKQSFYILDGSESRFSNSFVYGRVSNLKKISVDLLLQANGQTKMPVRPLDLIVNKQFRDKSMDGQELKDINNFLVKNLPTNLKSDPEVLNFFPTGDQKNASLNYRFNYGPEFYAMLAGMDTGTMIAKLTKFIEEYPHKHKMTLPPENPETYPVLNGTLPLYIEDLGRKLKAMTSSKEGDSEAMVLERLNAFRDMKTDPNFEKFIITEFFATLAAENSTGNVDKDFGLTLTFSAKETPTKVKHFGTFNSSEIYNAVAFFRSAVTDRSFDLRLETVEAQTKNGARQIEIPLNFTTPSED